MDGENYNCPLATNLSHTLQLRASLNKSDIETEMKMEMEMEAGCYQL
jgi:hypothetical protein